MAEWFPGDFLHPGGDPKHAGSIGTKVEDSYMLSAAHVVGTLSRVPENRQACAGDQPPTPALPGSPIGEIVRCHPRVRPACGGSAETDSVLIRLAPRHTMSRRIRPERSDEGPRDRQHRGPLSMLDARFEDPIRVWKQGAATGYREGHLLPESVEIDVPMWLDLDSGYWVTYPFLIPIVGDDTPFSLDGDSGAVVCDMEGNVLGLLVTMSFSDRPSAHVSYCVPIEDIAVGLGLELGGTIRLSPPE